MNLSGLAGPTAQSFMTSEVGPSEQDQLQGAIGALRGIAGLIGPILFTLVFAHAINAPRVMPGAPFYLAALLSFASLLIAVRVTSADRTSTPQPGN